ncbi:uncharacterized protein LOC135711095 [Ochlerotatus camptorhynchus]|uniref:uncharacterized protein LOC135711095 n=1 Tax=Ochlerotatus camptorhynchus TaxID=644619 RepID=UPI0031E0AA50
MRSQQEGSVSIHTARTMVMDAAALRLADLEARRICRFCLRSCSTDDELTAIGKDRKLASRIGFALTLEVTEQDGLPQRICGGCQWLMEKFYLFKDQCIRAEMLLKTFAESGMPLMQYFEPVDFAEFRWKRKWGNEIDVGIQVEDTMGIMMVKKEKPETESEYEMIAPEMIKQEVEAEDWSLGEEVDAVENLDRVTMDEIARQLYETEETTLNSFSTADQEVDESTPDGVHNMAELITEMDIGSAQLATINVDLYEDISNDTVEFAHVPKTSSIATEPNQPMEPISSTEEMLLLLKDGDQHEPTRTITEFPQSPSDLIYEGLQTTPLCESDGLPSRFVNMEPGEIVSDDEYDEVVIISSDTEDNQPDEQPSGSVSVPTPVQQDPPKSEHYRCQKCDKFFPQSQLLESHVKAYHMVSPAKSTGGGPVPVKKFVPGKSASKHKMAIMIDNPVKKCPKCGTMVHKASYWAHMRSHRSGGEEPVMNYEKESTVVEELWD